MDVRDLESFVVVSEEGSISRAAARLRISQPPLSTRIQALERDLDVQLLVRHGRGVETTAAGRVLAERARRLLADLASARREVQAIGLGAHGRLRVAVGPAVVPLEVTRLLSAVRIETPAVDVELVNADDPRAVDALRHGDVDVALAPRARSTDTAAPARRTESGVIAREPLIVVLASAHHEAIGERVDLNDLGDAALVSLGPATSPVMHEHVTSAWRSVTGRSPKVVPVASMSGLLSMILAGLGVALLPASYERILWPGLEARPLRHHVPVIETAIFWRQDDHSPIIRRFLRTALSTPEPDMLEPHHSRIEPWVDDDSP